MDVIGPDEAVGEWRLGDDAEAVLAGIAERAAQSDQHGIARSEIDALADAGLLGEALEPSARQREIAERIAMADASVWFCWTQHQTPMKTLAAAHSGDHVPVVEELQDRWLEGLRSGRYLGAVAFAHLRRPGPPNPVAERVHGGWSITGKLDWVTSWDIADVMLVMVRASGDYADKIVCFYLAAGRDPAYLSGMHVHEPLKLLAMSGTHTRPITFDQVMIPDTSVAALIDFNDWQQADAMKTIDVNPASFGIIRGAVQELREIAEKRQNPQLFALVESFATQARELRRRAYAAIDSNGPADERISLRAQALRMAVDAATAVVTARAGAAMYSGCSAERRVREAMFLQVQAQTARTREASLSLLM
ncbi:MAG: acyl-CoA/acyl-ACP dehydrogenase [Actinomycetota bacterium]|nr:acyl-CoA/acyl-ACP dehydrogenase [Actinomycetota bacterium]